VAGFSGEVAEELEGIDAVGVIFEPGLLGLAERCVAEPNYTLNIRVGTGEGSGQGIPGAVIRIVEDTDRAKGRIVPGEQDGFIGHITFLIQDQEGQLVVIVIFVFRELGEIVVFPEGLQQGEEIVVFRDVELGNVSAAQAKILVNVVGEVFQLLRGLFTGQ
jgi:hypothetical protein